MSERKSQWELFLEEEENPKPKEKQCSKCKKYKPLSEYHKRKNRKSGIASRCKACIHEKQRKTHGPEDRFWKRFHAKCSRVGNCIEWNGRYNKGKTPICTWEGAENISLRRVVYKLSLGDVPDDMVVLMICDNLRCVKHSHMRLATKIECEMKRIKKAPIGDRNGARIHPDRISRGDNHYARRRPECLARGSRNGRAKLTENDVRAVRRLYAQGEKTRVLADAFRVSIDNIESIIHNKTWKHVQ